MEIDDLKEVQKLINKKCLYKRNIKKTGIIKNIEITDNDIILTVVDSQTSKLKHYISVDKLIKIGIIQDQEMKQIFHLNNDLKFQ
jgi:hypothetical protein